MAGLDSLCSLFVPTSGHAGVKQEGTGPAESALASTRGRHDPRSSSRQEDRYGHPVVLAMWERHAAICDHAPLAEVAEAQDLLAMFEPIDF